MNVLRYVSRYCGRNDACLRLRKCRDDEKLKKIKNKCTSINVSPVKITRWCIQFRSHNTFKLFYQGVITRSCNRPIYNLSCILFAYTKYMRLTASVHGKNTHSSAQHHTLFPGVLREKDKTTNVCSKKKKTNMNFPAKTAVETNRDYWTFICKPSRCIHTGLPTRVRGHAVPKTNRSLELGFTHLFRRLPWNGHTLLHVTHVILLYGTRARSE